MINDMISKLFYYVSGLMIRFIYFLGVIISFPFLLFAMITEPFFFVITGKSFMKWICAWPDKYDKWFKENFNITTLSD